MLLNQMGTCSITYVMKSEMMVWEYKNDQYDQYIHQQQNQGFHQAAFSVNKQKPWLVKVHSK